MMKKRVFGGFASLFPSGKPATSLALEADMLPQPTLSRTNTARTRTSQVQIPVADISIEEEHHEKLFELGRHFARQDEWERLGEMIRDADHDRRQTPAGTPQADLIAEGARSDVVSAALQIVRNGEENSTDVVMNEFRSILDEFPDDHGIAYIVAMAYIDIGWAWRGEGWRKDLPNTHRTAFTHNFKCAAQIIDKFDPFELDAPMIAAMRCALLTAESRPSARVADDYEDLIDLAPDIAKHMRAMGNHLLPRWFGSYDRLEHEARRTMERTIDVWGAGAYTWVYLDALTVDDGAFATLDGDLFAEGLRDILERRSDQFTVNHLASFTGCTVSTEGLHQENRRKVSACFDWIVLDYLKELHPRVWYAAKGAWSVRLTEEQRFEKGRQRALSVLALRLGDQVGPGEKLSVGRSGLSIVTEA